MSSVMFAVNRISGFVFGIRNYSMRAVSLVYSEYGEPVKVIQPTEEQLPPLKPNQVVLKMLAAPVNPADVNTIQGNI